MAMKIAVYAISKNESSFVERFCVSAKDADLILIADTGSADDTVEIARKNGAVVHDICITPWRFDKARDAALALVPRDIDVCISLDLDETLEPGWREEIERVWKLGETTRLRYKFDWGSGIVFYGEKIHARHGYHWHHPCHERIRSDGRVPEVSVWTDMLLVVHKPDPAKSRGQYLDLLKLSVAEDPRCPRNAFYYARELSFSRMWREAIIECERYLALPGATWANERCYAYRVMARCYDELGDWNSAIKAARMGVIEAPNTREPWCEVAKLTYKRRHWAECYGAAMSALEVKERELVYTVDPEAWGALPHDYASIAAWNIGLKDQAIFHAKQAVSLNPDDERLQKNLILVQERRSGGRMHRLRQSGTESASVVADRALGRGTS
jgi:glycosyltransferase involved in cell wall biosynthesis